MAASPVITQYGFRVCNQALGFPRWIRQASCVWTKAVSGFHDHDRIMFLTSDPSSPPTPPVGNDVSVLKDLRLSMTEPVDVNERTEILELKERIQEMLRTSSDALETMKLIDELERLGIGYQFEDEIHSKLQQQLLIGQSNNDDDDDLCTTSLRFRLLRDNGYCISQDVFRKFLNKRGKFNEFLTEDTMGMLSLYEASYLGASGEEIMLEAQKFTENNLKRSLETRIIANRKQVLSAIDLPRHLRMSRLETMRFIEEYDKETHDLVAPLVQLAKYDYNQVQSLHQMELAEISRWWKQLGLVENLTFARDRPLECFLWTVGILPEPKYSECRIELAKTIAILLVIDDIFDTFGTQTELLLFTDAIKRWDLNAIGELPTYMKICYMALYNTTNEISYKILKRHGWVVLPYLKTTWIDMIEGFMMEAKWLSNGHTPDVEEYIENGVRTGGAYMALVHIFFLIGKGVTDENVQMLTRPYPKLFSLSGRILRLWDDLGTAKEEQERGDIASSMQLFMRENNIINDAEAKKHVMQLILGLWRDLNKELISEDSLPLPIIKASLNMARTSQVVYKHENDSYFSNVDNYVKALFFTSLT